MREKLPRIAHWRHAVARGRRRTVVDSEGAHERPLSCASDEVWQCEMCQAPLLPLAGASTSSSFNENVQVDLLFPDDVIALRAIGLYSEYSLLVRV